MLLSRTEPQSIRMLSGTSWSKCLQEYAPHFNSDVRPRKPTKTGRSGARPRKHGRGGVRQRKHGSGRLRPE